MGKKLSTRQRVRLLFDIFLIIVALVFFFNSLELDFRPWLFPAASASSCSSWRPFKR
jgi:hypothetical protein